ncbi:hypothetical protein [Kingella oralis]|jgi:hypothetical protein|uniref:hypothetical protein n=1 Tax=Kingella oralis TaxID=505 RepID=UPI0034E4C748
MSNNPDTPFAELLHAVQSNATHITWQKSSPISNRERGDAKKAMKRFLLITFLTLLMLIDKMSNYFCYFLPRVCSPRNPPQSLADWLLALFWLFFYTALPFNFFMMFRQACKIAHHPTEQPCPITYTLQTKASFRYLLAKGIFASRGMSLSPDWQKFTATDWAEILPTATPNEVQQLSQMIIQRLNNQ